MKGMIYALEYASASPATAYNSDTICWQAAKGSTVEERIHNVLKTSDEEFFIPILLYNHIKMIEMFIYGKNNNFHCVLIETCFIHIYLIS